MELSNSLVKSFASALISKTDEKKETTFYGTVVKRNNNILVKLDGSALETPVTTAMDVNHGDRVIVAIKDHKAVVTGNVSAPADAAKPIVNSILIYDHTYTIEDDIASFEAFLYRGGQDVKTEFPPEDFTWYLKTEDGTTYLGSGYTTTVSLSSCGYGAEVIGCYGDYEDVPIADQNGNGIQTDSGISLTARSDVEGYVKVTELPVLQPLITDYLMGIGPTQEYIMSISTLKNLIGGAMTYTELQEKPQIEGVTLEGDKTFEELNLGRVTNSELEAILVL